MDKPKLYKDRNHDHYWIEDGILRESYTTLRGMRWRAVLEVPGMPDSDRLDEAAIEKIETEFLK